MLSWHLRNRNPTNSHLMVVPVPGRDMAILTNKMAEKDDDEDDEGEDNNGDDD